MTASIVTDLAAVELDELVARADLQRRFDVKFLVANHDVPTLIAQLAARHADAPA